MVIVIIVLYNNDDMIRTCKKIVHIQEIYFESIFQVYRVILAKAQR